MQQLEVPQGTFALERHPPAGRRPLRAWDAADELLLEHLAGQDLPPPERRLVVDDAHGALAVALTEPDGSPQVLLDSHVAELAMRSNLERNRPGRALPVVHHGPGVPTELAGTIDLVVFKLPKSLAAFGERLFAIRAVAAPGARIVGAAMVRHLHRSHLELCERTIGPTSTSLARRKARLVHCELDGSLDPPSSTWPAEYQLPGGGTVVCHAGVHSAGRLDPGTRLLLEHLPAEAIEGTVVDLGCGDGAIGLRLAQLHPQARVLAVDESHAALASARATFERNGVSDRVEVLVGDVLERSPGEPLIGDGSVDLVVVNPPFHADHAVEDDTAWRMFTQSHRALAPGGSLVVVGNRHLGHHAKLRRIFGNCEVLGSNPKFVVCRAVRGADGARRLR